MGARDGASGFNAEKFRKLVAMFDSPFAEEADNAFRQAFDELKKSRDPVL